MGTQNIGFRLGAYELEVLTGGKNNKLLYVFQILEVLYINHLPMTCKEIEEKLDKRYDWYIMNKTSRRKLEITLQKLLESVEDIVERVDDGWPSKYKLADLFDMSSTKYGKKDLRVFEEWKAILDKYDFIPFMSDLKDVVARDFNGLENTLATTPVIDLPVFEYHGEENIPPLFKAIVEESKIDFTYRNKIEVIDFMPYLLKEHNKRWYVVGKNAPEENFIVYSLEKISKCYYSNKKDVFEREEFDAKGLFQHSVGIYTSWKDSDLKYDSKAEEEFDPINISFKVKDGEKFDNVSYLISNKIHQSQKESKPDKDGWVTISLNMFPETDLIRAIRGIGLHCIKDIQPTKVKRWVEEL
jgi:hypothetical protein